VKQGEAPIASAPNSRHYEPLPTLAAIVPPPSVASDPECLYGPSASLTLLIAEIDPSTDA
jgi:hypothetical protein